MNRSPRSLWRVIYSRRPRFWIARGAARPVIRAVLGTWVFGLWSLAGCDIPERPPVSSSGSPPPVPAAPAGAPAEGADRADREGELVQDWQTWEVYYVKDQPVGFSHVTCQVVEDDAAGESLRYLVEDEITLARGDAKIAQVLHQSSTESRAGELRGFESDFQVGPAITYFTGSVEGSSLVVQTRRGQQRITDRIPWRASHRGLVAVQQSLRWHPMQPGDSRTLKMLLPISHRVATVRLDCVGEASVPLLDGEHQELLEVVNRVLVDDRVTSRSVMWIDRDGHTRRTYTPSIGLVTYRSDRATAEAAIEKIAERRSTAWLEVAGKLEDPAGAKRVGYRVTLAPAESGREDPLTIEPAAGQYVREKAPGEFEVVVSRRAERTTGGFAAAGRETVQADLEANAVLDFRSRPVRDISDAAVASKDLSDREVAIEMTRTLHSLMSVQPSTAGIRPASEVAHSTRGDSTDHAVLLAALLRARGIPSRLALGVRYLAGESPAMGYHMWTLAHVDGAWVPLDATVGGTPPPDRLTLVTSNLSDGNLHGAMQQFLAILGRLRVVIQGSQ